MTAYQHASRASDLLSQADEADRKLAVGAIEFQSPQEVAQHNAAQGFRLRLAEVHAQVAQALAAAEGMEPVR